MSEKRRERNTRLEDLVDNRTESPDDADLRRPGADPNRLDSQVSDLETPNDEQLNDEELARIENAMAFIQGLQREFANPSADDPINADTAKMDLDGTINTSQSSEPPESEVENRQGLPPQTIGRFVIERLLGQGGFARVYLAHDPTLNRKIAIKVLKPTSFISSDASNRFDREAQAAAILNHPNIIPVFESGMIGSDRFIVSAFSHGITLKEWTDQQTEAISPRSAAEIISTLADAVEHAHQRGIVHRDLKPANVLVETTDDGSNQFAGAMSHSMPGVLRVTDFGLAKYADSVDQLETADGAIVGTPAYMSPEQAKGDLDIGCASDIYSLGVILYELLTGQLPIIGKTHIETLLAIGKLEPKPPRRVNPAVPRDLEAICLKCLRKSPADRYSSSLDLALDLRRWLNGDVVAARRVSHVERAGKWCVRNPALSAAFLAITVALVVASFQWRNAVKESDRADRNFSMTQDLIDELVTEVAENSDLPPNLRRTFSERAVNLQVQLLAEDPDNERVIKQTANAYRRFARLLGDIGDVEAALDAINQSLELVEPYTDDPGFSEIKMISVRYKAGILRTLGEAEEAARMIVEAKKNTNQTNHDKAKNYVLLGIVKGTSGRNQEAIADFETALMLYEDCDTTHPAAATDIARLQFHYACSEMNLDLLDEAKTRLQLANLTFESNVANMPNHARDKVLQDCARCHLQLARISWEQSGREGVDNAEKAELLAESRSGFGRADELFSQVIEVNPMLNGGWGQLAMVYQLRTQLEIGEQQEQSAASTVEKFAELFEKTPERVREYRIIGEIMIDSHLRLSKLFLKKEHTESAVNQLNAARTLLDKLIDKYPDSPLLVELEEQCDQLLDEHGA